MESQLDPKAREALERAKAEIAQDMELFNKAQDRGNLTSHTVGVVGGNIGGVMVRRLIEMGEQILIDQYKNNK